MSEVIPEWETVAVSVIDDIVELRLHSGEGSLVWSATSHREVMEAFGWAGSRRSTKAVIITGTGETFCSSIDVASFKGMPWDEIWWEGRRMLQNISDIDVPVIAAVNGPATAHAEIAVLADIVIASDTAVFGDHIHITRRTAPGDGAHAVWANLLGPSRVKYFLLTAATIDAHEGRTIGFVHEVLPYGEVLPRAHAIAEQLATLSVPVLRFSKAAVSIAARRFFAEDLSHGLGLEGSGHWVDGGISS
ncbi:enoyl-CoA hydratase/isomerase family protein [Subtercola endophyticus]|uniref:enoyl-CoA hydratase/isomerase family protein n=1 Tax=Subtercola endophyticus TaxID=2895559 RepID=UPI001E331779|nr:enoyl-CoA hydratase/isomerase family protein [Subtercola endophyticus]UFS58103.1 enoyl-CoA hydratase/isomerase family protein [Subtercola endophyticus]